MCDLGFLLLSGGHSSRMGMPKALIDWQGRPLIHTIAKAGEGFSQRILSVNDPAIPTPDGFVRVPDIVKDCGPLSGLHAALCYTKCDALVVAPCDTPRYSVALAYYLRQTYQENDNALILMDHTGRVHPTLGVYAKRCLPVIEEHIVQNKLKILPILELLNARIISLPDTLNDSVFINLNTPNDLVHLRHSGIIA